MLKEYHQSGSAGERAQGTEGKENLDKGLDCWMNHFDCIEILLMESYRAGKRAELLWCWRKDHGLEIQGRDRLKVPTVIRSLEES